MGKLLFIFIIVVSLIQSKRRKKNLIEDYDENQFIKLEKLETKDTDPKIVNKEILARYYGKEKQEISRIQFRNIICERYHEVSYKDLENFYIHNSSNHHGKTLTTKQNSKKNFYLDLDEYMMSKKQFTFAYDDILEMLNQNDYHKYFIKKYKNDIKKVQQQSFYQSKAQSISIKFDEL